MSFMLSMQYIDHIRTRTKTFKYRSSVPNQKRKGAVEYFLRLNVWTVRHRYLSHCTIYVLPSSDSEIRIQEKYQAVNSFTVSVRLRENALHFTHLVCRHIEVKGRQKFMKLFLKRIAKFSNILPLCSGLVFVLQLFYHFLEHVCVVSLYPLTFPLRVCENFIFEEKKRTKQLW